MGEYGECIWPGCLWCDTLGTCKKCSPGFQLSEDAWALGPKRPKPREQDRGTCIFSITADGWANMAGRSESFGRKSLR